MKTNIIIGNTGSYSPIRIAGKKILPLALSMAGTQFINVASGFLCMMMIAQLGHQALAASALMISTQIAIMVIGMSILFSLSLLIGHAFGAKNYQAITNYLQQGWIFAFLVSIPIMIIFWFIGPVLKFLHEPVNLIPTVTSFFHAYIWAVLPFQLAVCNQQLCYGMRQQRLAVVTACLGVTVLLITAYVLIFGKFGFPNLGVEGLGYAIAAQAWFSFIFLILLLYHGKAFKELKLFALAAPRKIYLQQMFKIGWPMSLQMSAEMVSFFGLSLMVGWIGPNALAAYQIINQYLFIFVVPIFALSQAVGISVGQVKGAGQIHEIKNMGYAGLRIALTWSCLAAVIFIACPKLLASLYLDIKNPNNIPTLTLVSWLFAIAAFSQILDSTRNVMSGALRGLFDTRYPMIIGIISLWFICLPLAYLFAFILHLGLYGIALGSLSGFFIGATAILYRWRIQISKL